MSKSSFEEAFQSYKEKRMRKIGILIIIIGIVTASAAGAAYYFFVIHKPKHIISDKQIEELIKEVNNSSQGLTLELEPQNVEIKSDMKTPFDKPQYLITINKARFIFDSTFFESHTSAEIPFTVPVTTEKIIARYRTIDNHLSLVRIDAIDVDLKGALQSTLKEGSSPFTGSALFHIGEVNLKDFDLSPLLIKKDSSDPLILGSNILEANSSYSITSHDISVKIDEKTNESLMLDIKTIKADQNFNSDFIKAILEKSKEKVDLLSFTQLSESIQAYTMKAEDIKVTHTDKSGQKSGATLASFGFSYNLEPSQDKNMFKGSLKQYLQELNAQIPLGAARHSLWAKSFTNIKDSQLYLTVDRISPSLLNIYRDMIQENLLSDTQKSDEMKKQQFSAYGFRLIGVLMQSQPTLSFNLSPFKLSFAQLEAKGSFQLGLGPFPTGKANATIFNLAELKDTLINQNVMQPDEAEGFIFLIKNYFVLDSAGNGVLTFEVRSESPNLLLNGKPLI